MFQKEPPEGEGVDELKKKKKQTNLNEYLG
jgi:hypothetical protein